MRSTITDVGRQLLSRLELGEISLRFMDVRCGAGIYSPQETIAGRTALKDERNSYPISSAMEDANGLLITSAISNVDGTGQAVVTESYRINELGVFVSVDDTEYLYMIAVADNDEGNVMPAFNGNNPIDFVEKFLLTISNTAQVTVDMSGAYALVEDVTRWITEAVSGHAALATHLTSEERVRWNGEEEVETVFNQDGSITETTELGDKVTTFNQDGSITESYPDGRVLLTTFNADGSISRRVQLLEDNNEEEVDES